MSEIETVLTITGIVLVVFSIIGGGLKENKTTASPTGSLVRVVFFFVGGLLLLLGLLIESGFFKHI
jgi:uncharacterized membrane protein